MTIRKATKKDLAKALELIKKYHDTLLIMNAKQLERVHAQKELEQFERNNKAPFFTAYFWDNKTTSEEVFFNFTYLASKYNLTIDEFRTKLRTAEQYITKHTELQTAFKNAMYTENYLNEYELPNIRHKYETLIDNTTLFEDYGLTYNIVDMYITINLF